ncbi:MAG TPA: PadR family transcriptional regulator [Longimicrobiaceae bacterium]|nr:PadR family transcriptional regulator [Longimicrobiaceae bacterium]
MPRNIIDSVQGTLDFLILKTLSWNEMHGYAIARWILDASGDELQIEEGTLYPALHRMEDRGWIAAKWGLSENNRRAKFYHLTVEGRQELAARTTSWARFTTAVDRILKLTPSRA